MRRLIIDVSSVCWMAIMAGKDKEYGRTLSFNGKDHFINGIEFVHDNAMNHLLSVMENYQVTPHRMIFVVEGQNSKALRHNMFPGYKEGSERPPEFYELFNELKNRLVDEFLSVGASACSQDGLESDDVIAWLCENLEGERIVVSRDGDLAVLVGGDVHQVRMGVYDENPYGPFPHKYITTYKALVGDTSDGYKGVHGFGEKAFLDLYVNFDDAGLEIMGQLLEQRRLGELAEDVPSFPKLQKIIDNADAAYTCWNLAKLYPQLVNTMRKPLQWRVGMVKMRAEVADERLHQWAGVVRLVTAENFDTAWGWARPKIEQSPFVALDIETSTPDESDDWLAAAKGVVEAAEKAFSEENRSFIEDEPVARFTGLGVDVFGSELTGLGLTFGDNNQYTLYFSVDHRDTKNLTSGQVADVIYHTPRHIPIVVHNASFELSVLHQEWAKLEGWKDNAYQGFLPNIRDTQILASYVNENISSGLKQGSKHYLNYGQQTYQEVTGGLKMNQLTAQHVLGYGADDTRCTAALFNHFQTIMELERTWHVYEAVEIKPAYLLALAYVGGTPLSTSVMHEMEKDDDVKYQAAWEQVEPFLVERGWSGSKCPVLNSPVLTASDVKEACLVILNRELETRVRKLDKLADAVAALDSPAAGRLADMVVTNNVASINAWMSQVFVPEPGINLNSPKQMRDLMYNHIGLPVRVVNNPTDKERTDNPELARAVTKYQKIWAGKIDAVLSDEEKELLKQKAKTNSIAMDFATAFDGNNPNVGMLKALKVMKSVDTRRKMFYKPYRFVQHWKDGRVHAGIRQVGTVTRRMSSSGPNLQQLPKKGDGIRFREAFVPHHRKAVIVSIDFAGQELRLGAGQSLDPNMMACFVGPNLKDMHSLTAAGAMDKKWGEDRVQELAEMIGFDCREGNWKYDLFSLLRKSPDKAVAKAADDLRKVAKNVNFGAQYDAMAPKLAETLIIAVIDAQLFLDAKFAMFPRFEVWKEEVKADLKVRGYVTTMMGARRHLAVKLLSDDGWEKEKAMRQGPNFKIQGSGAEMTKLSMARLWDSGAMWKYDAKFIAPIHDELVVSVAATDAVEFIRTMHQCMTQPYADLPVPIMGSISLGPSLGKQIECGDEFDEAAIRKALAEVMGEELGVAA